MATDDEAVEAPSAESAAQTGAVVRASQPGARRWKTLRAGSGGGSREPAWQPPAVLSAFRRSGAS